MRGRADRRQPGQVGSAGSCQPSRWFAPRRASRPRQRPRTAPLHVAGAQEPGCCQARPSSWRRDGTQGVRPVRAARNGPGARPQRVRDRRQRAAGSATSHPDVRRRQYPDRRHQRQQHHSRQNLEQDGLAPSLLAGEGQLPARPPAPRSPTQARADEVAGSNGDVDRDQRRPAWPSRCRMAASARPLFQSRRLRFGPASCTRLNRIQAMIATTAR